jgi:hypothetical protein
MIKLVRRPPWREVLEETGITPLAGSLARSQSP